MTVARLGYLVQVLFEMKASHLMAIDVPSGENLAIRIRSLHQNKIDGIWENILRNSKNEIQRYVFFDDEFEDFTSLRDELQTLDATQVRIKHALGGEGEKLNVNYDFGDNWWVSLTLEKVFSDEKLDGKALPRVLDGSGFGIVEDVGGIGGLGDLVKIFNKKSGRKYEDYCVWLGITDFDIHAFDVDDMNFRVKKIPRIYKQAYEDGLEPTQRSIDLIERKY
jgi:hypothetical protein